MLPVSEVSSLQETFEAVLPIMGCTMVFGMILFSSMRILVAVWITLGSLQMIAHMILVIPDMPSRPFFMLLGALSWLKLDILIPGSTQELSQEDQEISSFNEIRA
jgi:hypothetical protein